MTGTRCSHLTPVGNRSPTKEQDRFLPIANVSRIMKKSLPANAKISKQAKETVQGCVSEFITFITGEASDRCQREKRKTINGDDLLWAMTTLGFEKYVVPLKVHLSKYREIEGEKSSVTTQGDQSVSPPEEPYHGAAKLGGVTVANGNTTTGPTMGYMMGLSSFNGGLYSQFPEEGLMAHGDWKELKTGQISHNG